MSNQRFERLNGATGDGVDILDPEECTKWDRSPFEEDVDRIKYTSKFRRLKDITQVAQSGEPYLYHDRMSHSLKVAQVGRRLAELLRRKEILTSDNSGKISVPESTAELSKELSDGLGTGIVPSSLDEQLNPDVVAASCLAHDLGHPPFGHIAENELDRKIFSETHSRYDIGDDKSPDEYDRDSIKKSDVCEGLRFEGNAQSFRILNRLTVHQDTKHGLGLTRATLASVLKYPWGRGEWPHNEKKGKFGYYRHDKELFDFARGACSVDNDMRTIEAAIMDYADDVSYAVHDLVDFTKGGHIPLGNIIVEYQLLREHDERGLTSIEYGLDVLPEKSYFSSFTKYLKTNTEITSSYEKLVRLINLIVNKADMKGYLPGLLGDFSGSRLESEALKHMQSDLIDWFIGAETLDTDRIYMLENNGQWELRFGWFELLNGEKATVKELLDIMQQMTIYFVIKDQGLVSQQKGQRKMIRDLFDIFLEEAEAPGNDSALPEEYRRYAEGNHPAVHSGMNASERYARVAADFISGMTETQAIDMYKRVKGVDIGSMNNKIVKWQI